MPAKICDLRDQTAVRLTQLALPLPVTITTKPLRGVEVDDVDSTTLLLVGPAAQQFARSSRGDATAAPIVVVGVHRKLGSDDDGNPDPVLFDDLVHLCEVIAERLLAPLPDLQDAWPTAVEIPQIYQYEKLVKNGVFQCAILITFHREFEVAS